MPLRIANARTDHIAVDFSGVAPQSLAALSLDDVRRTTVRHGNRDAELGELFTIDGDPRDIHWRLEGDFLGVHWLGAGMTAGEIFVDGRLGRHAGSRMQGGRIEIRGDVSDFLGAEMRGGVIRARRNAGNFVGAAYVGSPRGMTGGQILIDGAAGRELGARMRRGLIAVAGMAREDLGARMLAGTILVFGQCGARPGAGMRRGTIGLFDLTTPKLLPTYRLACRATLPMLGLIERELRYANFGTARLAQLTQPIELYNGDLLELGRGEILIPASSAGLIPLPS